MRAKKPKGLYTISQTTPDEIREQTSAVLGYSAFSELAVCVMLKQLLRQKRCAEAQVLLRSYIKKHGLTPHIVKLMANQELFAAGL